MIWGDARLDKIEKANLDGSGRTVLLTETGVYYIAFVLHAGNVYFTDWHYAYDYLFITRNEDFRSTEWPKLNAWIETQIKYKNSQAQPSTKKCQETSGGGFFWLTLYIFIHQMLVVTK